MLTFRQRYQQVEGEVGGAREFKFSGRLDGARLLAKVAGDAQLRGDRLVFAGTAPLAGAWTRMAGACGATKRRS